ncbi:MAG: cell division protein FtsQ/DivIB, partial [Candidatus Omnitrophota bacterium]
VFNLLNNANIYHKFFQITKINISTLDNFSFFIDKNIEVKLGLSNQREKLKILILLLNEIKEKPQDIKYIDLRFKEPIVAKVK